MPNKKPQISYTRIREYAERFSWIDPKTNEPQVGYNPPENAIERERMPFNIVALDKDGNIIRGRVICTEVNTSLHTRRIMFVNSGEFRWVSDVLIIEIDGVRFVTH